MTDYLYGGPKAGGRWETRHKAIGVAAVRGREEGEYLAARSDTRLAGVPELVLSYTESVEVLPWEWCRYCGEEFYEKGAYADHHPCDMVPEMERQR